MLSGTTDTMCICTSSGAFRRTAYLHKPRHPRPHVRGGDGRIQRSSMRGCPLPSPQSSTWGARCRHPCETWTGLPPSPRNVVTPRPLLQYDAVASVLTSVSWHKWMGGAESGLHRHHVRMNPRRPRPHRRSCHPVEAGG